MAALSLRLGWMDGRSSMYQQVCTVCNTEYESKTKRSSYCSKPCKEKGRRSRGIGPYYCKCCHKPFMAKKAEFSTFCSKTCSGKHRKRIATEIEGIRQLGKPNYPNGRKPMTRSIVSMEIMAIRRLGIQKYFAPKYRATCPICKVVHVVIRSHPKQIMDKVCPVCVRDNQRMHARKASVIRKRKIDRLTAERIDPLDILERDNWACYICGDQLKKEDRGSILLKAPEVDHIVPISKGGRHSWGNLACSCRQCNQGKSDKLLHEFVSLLVPCGI